MLIDSFSYTSRGGRSENQDAIGEKIYSDGAVYVVADGLGGHLHGEMASRCAVDTILAELPGEDPKAWLCERISQANKNILELQAKEHGRMKTTVTALTIRNDQASWAHVGDTRLYYLHNNTIESITADHSVAYRKYLSGEIIREEIGSDEDQSSLLRALGNPERFQPDCCTLDHPIGPMDGFLLCTDGVWTYLLDEEILVDYLKADCAETWAELLLLRVAGRISSRNDNLSLITIMTYQEQEEFYES